jgi:diadenosine tetraphosphate (Ap4A) HIT family hydrolase
VIDAMATDTDCELCEHPGGIAVANAARWRVIRVVDADFPAFYRVVWNAHAAEFTDLDPTSRTECLDVVARIETVLRERLNPTKLNLASLGNVVPHLHWHVIARFDWDSHFPQPVWGTRQREVSPSAERHLTVSLEQLDDAVRLAMPQALD